MVLIKFKGNKGTVKYKLENKWVRRNVVKDVEIEVSQETADTLVRSGLWALVGSVKKEEKKTKLKDKEDEDNGSSN